MVLSSKLSHVLNEGKGKAYRELQRRLAESEIMLWALFQEVSRRLKGNCWQCFEEENNGLWSPKLCAPRQGLAILSMNILHFHVYMFTNIPHSELDFFSKYLHHKIFQSRFHFRKAETADCNRGCVQMSAQWMKKVFSILLQMYFMVVREDNGSALTSAELNINYPRCVLTASFFQSSNETNCMWL